MTARRPLPVEGTTRHAPDYGLLALVVMLVVVGLIAVHSSSYALAEVQFDDPNYFIKRQAIWAGIGMLGLLFVMQLDYRLLLRLSPLLMLAAVVALAATLLPGVGVERNGASRWLALGPFAGQPSEFAKLAVLIYLAAWLAVKRDVVQSFSLGVLPFVAMVGLVGALIVLEPDLGTAVLVAAITGTLFFVAGARLIHVATLAGSGLAIAVLLIVFNGYRAQRWLSFTAAEDDPSNIGLQTLQLLVAFGSGGISGLGLGVSRQKFFYVPGSHTDGILAILGEELGLIGVSVVLLLFVLLLWRGLGVVRRAPDRFGSLLATGVLAWIAFQTLINVGGVTRMIPLTGIPLPFLSYGGSSIASVLLAVGVLLSVSRYASLSEAEEAPTRGVVAAQGGAR